MTRDDFEWDATKAAENYAKHGVSFEQAREAFDDPFGIDFADDREDYGAERYDGGHFKEAVDLFMRMSKSAQFDEFLSIPAYELLP